MASKMTLEELLASSDDTVLLNMELEIIDCVVPATSYTRKFIREVNKRIDAGTLCINSNSYRKVYLPTLIKALHNELAKRYTEALLTGRLTDDTETEDGRYIQMTLADLSRMEAN